MFTKEYNLRYSDLDNHIHVKISSILDILQDISIEHSASRGLTLKNLYSRSIAWLVQGWRIRFLEPVAGDRPITAKTGVMRIRQFEAQRKYEIWQDGALKVIATASWFTVNTSRMKVIIVPQEISDAYDELNEADNGLEFIKLRPEKDMPPAVSQTKVERRDIDTNNHMNNVKSVEVALELIPEDFAIGELMITYRKALLPSETVLMCAKQTENGYHTELKNGDGDTCVLLRAEKL
jgi:medium-chain acyl-[acyl-carrier-protein] hydrolase